MKYHTGGHCHRHADHTAYKCSAEAEMGDRLATINIGRKGGGCCALSGRGAGSPSNTIWPEPRSTCCMRYISHKNWFCASAAFTRGSWKRSVVALSRNGGTKSAELNCAITTSHFSNAVMIVSWCTGLLFYTVMVT